MRRPRGVWCFAVCPGRLVIFHQLRVFSAPTRRSSPAAQRFYIDIVASLLRGSHAAGPSPKAPRIQEVGGSSGGGHSVGGHRVCRSNGQPSRAADKCHDVR